MEKRRRARINESLNELKNLILEATKTDSSCYSKLEKADILDMTVRYLRTLKTQSNSYGTDSSFTAHYKAGFNECTNEILRYLSSTTSIDVQVKSMILSHLSSCLSPTARPNPYTRQTRKSLDQATVPSVFSGHYHVVPGQLPDGKVAAILVPSQSMGSVTPTQQFIPVKHFKPTIDSLLSTPVSLREPLWRPW